MLFVDMYMPVIINIIPMIYCVVSFSLKNIRLKKGVNTYTSAVQGYALASGILRRVSIQNYMPMPEAAKPKSSHMFKIRD